MSVKAEESVVVVKDVDPFQYESVIHVAEAGERKVSHIFFMSSLRSWREVRKSRDYVFVEKLERSEEESRLNPELVRNEMASIASGSIAQASFASIDLNNDGMIFPCLERVSLLILLRRKSMWMWLGAVPHCIVEWSLMVLPPNSLWAMRSCENQAGFFILLIFLCVSFV